MEVLESREQRSGVQHDMRLCERPVLLQHRIELEAVAQLEQQRNGVTLPRGAVQPDDERVAERGEDGPLVPQLLLHLLLRQHRPLYLFEREDGACLYISDSGDGSEGAGSDEPLDDERPLAVATHPAHRQSTALEHAAQQLGRERRPSDGAFHAKSDAIDERRRGGSLRRPVRSDALLAERVASCAAAAPRGRACSADHRVLDAAGDEQM
mmetsp:Transcript_27801/g.64895  ORF Transcript_27801/g.64895 Transcript_27801/m.64895 type:complete len:210 (-) Transcript_27801:1697-2326(-)